MGMQGGRALGKGQVVETFMEVGRQMACDEFSDQHSLRGITPRQSQLVWRVSERGGRGVLRMCDRQLSLLRMR